MHWARASLQVVPQFPPTPPNNLKNNSGRGKPVHTCALHHTQTKSWNKESAAVRWPPPPPTSPPEEKRRKKRDFGGKVKLMIEETKQYRKNLHVSCTVICWKCVSKYKPILNLQWYIWNRLFKPERQDCKEEHGYQHLFVWLRGIKHSELRLWIPPTIHQGKKTEVGENQAGQMNFRRVSQESTWLCPWF